MRSYECTRDTTHTTSFHIRVNNFHNGINIVITKKTCQLPHTFGSRSCWTFLRNKILFLVVPWMDGCMEKVVQFTTHTRSHQLFLYKLCKQESLKIKFIHSKKSRTLESVTYNSQAIRTAENTIMNFKRTLWRSIKGVLHIKYVVKDAIVKYTMWGKGYKRNIFDFAVGSLWFHISSNTSGSLGGFPLLDIMACIS